MKPKIAFNPIANEWDVFGLWKPPGVSLEEVRRSLSRFDLRRWSEAVALLRFAYENDLVWPGEAEHRRRHKQWLEDRRAS